MHIIMMIIKYITGVYVASYLAPDNINLLLQESLRAP